MGVIVGVVIFLSQRTWQIFFGSILEWVCQTFFWVNRLGIDENNTFQVIDKNNKFQLGIDETNTFQWAPL